MDKGDVLELEVVDVAFGGDGVCRSSAGVVFVPFAAVGDKLKVKLVRVNNRFMRGVIVDLLEPGQGRVEPPCKFYGTCGGCVYQHVDYETETKYKRKHLTDILTRLGGFDELPTVSPMVVSPAEYGYRNKLKLTAVPKRDKSGDVRTQFGYCAMNNRTRFAIDECILATHSINKTMKEVVTSDDAKEACLKNKPLILRQDAEGVTHHYFKRASRKTAFIKENVAGELVDVPVGSFWQVNQYVADKLFATLAAWFDESPTKVVVDAYAGTGPLSLALGHPEVKRVLIELDDLAMRAAEDNHKNRGLDKVVTIAGKTEFKLPQVLDRYGKDATVIIDPPRTGCDASVIKCLLESNVSRIICVSCNPSTLARDLKTLCEKSFRLDKLAQFDMFPRTAHFETAVALLRNG